MSVRSVQLLELLPLLAGLAMLLPLAACQQTQSTSSGAGANTSGGATAIRTEPFGVTADGQAVEKITLVNQDGMVASFITWGATLTDLYVRDRSRTFEDVVLGFDNIQQYETQSPYFGCTTGRVANRIARGTFTLNGKTYQLATNNDPNHLHGGVKGLDKRIWRAQTTQTADGPAVKFTYSSPDGEEGYPGNLDIAVTYTLTNKNELKIEYAATTDQPTPVNLTHHSYFNLTGNPGGDILDHRLQLEAARYTPADETLIPTGEITSVEGTPFDFRRPTPIGDRIDRIAPTTGNPPGGYDLNYVVDGRAGRMRLAATVLEPRSGRVMEVWTDQPGIQFYSGNFLDGSITGKRGVTYDKHAGFCLETQHFPDSVNQPNFPSTILNPRQTYRHVCIYRFSTR